VILRAGVRDAVHFGSASGAVLRDVLVGAVLALPPGSFPLTFVRKMKGVPALLSILRTSPRSLPQLARFTTSIERNFPPDPSWYVELIGVEPRFQGSGLGTRMLASVLERADGDGAPTYLETAQPNNVGYYERFGFHVVEEVTLIPHGPPHWTMIRPPQPQLVDEPPPRSVTSRNGPSVDGDDLRSPS
jgi:hypothetical protein